MVPVIFFTNQYKKKKEPISPPLPPTPTPTPTPTPSGVSPAPANKITELQNLMIKRYEQLNKPTEYDKNAAFNPPGWGNLSTNALKYLQPTNFGSWGIPNANNIDKWIASIKKDVEIASKEIVQQQQTAQKTTDAIALEKKLINHLNAAPGINKIELLSNVSAKPWKYDDARGRYVLLDESAKTFYKGTKFVAKEITGRGNGTLGPSSGTKRYFISSNAFIATT